MSCYCASWEHLLAAIFIQERFWREFDNECGDDCFSQQLEPLIAKWSRTNSSIRLYLSGVNRESSTDAVKSILGKSSFTEIEKLQNSDEPLGCTECRKRRFLLLGLQAAKRHKAIPVDTNTLDRIRRIEDKVFSALQFPNSNPEPAKAGKNNEL